jgi:hypothetical protein
MADMLLEESPGTQSDANPEHFQNPVKRIGVSGGTAPFFLIKLTEGGKEKVRQVNNLPPNAPVSTGYFIGKDLSRAEDELDMYEDIAKIQKAKKENPSFDDGGLCKVLDFCFEYAGVVTLNEMMGDEPVPRQLLVMRNLRDGYSALRLLDLKVGEKTAAVNWRGKSRYRAYKQGFVDGYTNSNKEGYRLEGFDGQNDVLNTMDPLLDFRITNRGSHADKEVDSKTEKKMARMNLQRLSGRDVFMHYLDLHSITRGNEVAYMEEPPASEEMSERKEMMETKEQEVPDDEEKIDTEQNKLSSIPFTKSELTEIVLHETVKRLTRYAIACHKLSIPQKWIGSSIALGYDAGGFSLTEEEIRASTVVNAFDWGRSELLTKEKFEALSKKEQKDREQYWEYYKNGVAKLSFIAAKKYYRQFDNSDEWNSIKIRVMDYDSSSADDLMGEVSIDLPKVPKDNMPVSISGEYTLNGVTFGVGCGMCRKDCGSVLVKMVWSPSDNPSSRLKGVWLVTVEKGKKFKILDFVRASSDPYCLVIAKGAVQELRQMTSVKIGTLNPVWNETFEVPVMSGASKFKAALKEEGLDYDSDEIEKMFTMDAILPLRKWQKDLISANK